MPYIQFAFDTHKKTVLTFMNTALSGVATIYLLLFLFFVADFLRAVFFAAFFFFLGIRHWGKK